jgi:proton-coupled amino acid transporter
MDMAVFKPTTDEDINPFLQAFVAAITNCATIMPIQYMILIQIVVFLPLALIRNLARLSTTALVADVFIIAGLIYIFGSEARIMARHGPAHVELFNPKDFALMIGTAIFSFEGIGLVIPVTDAMKEPHKFPKVLTGVMLSLMGSYFHAFIRLISFNRANMINSPFHRWRCHVLLDLRT